MSNLTYIFRKYLFFLISFSYKTSGIHLVFIFIIDNIASKGIVWQIPSGSTNVGLAKDGIESTCVKTTGPNGRFHIDLQKKSIVTEVYIILGI